MSWYRTYRPISVAGLHLDHVREAILAMMQRGVFPHAMLMAGPKGTGKTSAARVIAALLNDPRNAESVIGSFFDKTKLHIPFVEPDDKNELVGRIFRGSSMVVTELDAASYRGIDDIRSLKERLYLLPQEGNVAVYVLDEVHMFTTEAWNALLKVLEEPPAHVVFILATTELHKVPETIVSRCALLQFSKASHEELLASLKVIMASEKIECQSEALDLIIEHAGGSFRDGVKLLEMVCSGRQSVTLADAEMVLGGSQMSSCLKLVQLVVAKDAPGVAQFFTKLREVDTQDIFFYESLLRLLHSELMAGLGVSKQVAQISKEVAHYLLVALQGLDLSSAAIPYLALELKLLEIIFKAQSKGTQSKAGEKNSGGGSGESSPEKTSSSKKMDESIPVADTIPTGAKASPAAQSADATLITSQWSVFLEKVSLENGSLSALLRSATLLGTAKSTISIGVYYQFHKDKLESRNMMEILERVALTLVQGLVRFQFSVVVAPIHAGDPDTVGGSKTSSIAGQADQTLVTLAAEVLM